MPSARPVLLVGCPRSGTTLLSVILHAHPRIAMPPETRFLWPVYQDRNSFGDLNSPRNRRKLARRITRRDTRFVQLGLDRKKVIRRIVKAPPTVGSAMAIVWQEFARSRGKQRWGEKRPLYWQQMDWLMRLFPDAQVVHLIRDPRACVSSLLDVHWWHGGFYDAVTTWVMSDRELKAFGKRAASDSYYALRYEDLLAEPRAELSKLCDFLGEDFDEAMLEFAKAAEDIVPERKVWHSRTHGPLDSSRGERWRTRLQPDQVALIEAVAVDQMRANGYEPSASGEPPSGAARARYRLEYARRYASVHGARAIDRVKRRREKQDVAAVPSATSV
ncbi:MAG TPA: sulfotransferase [Jatrophihabitantaceae bacterium]|jgi:hypothetical protein